MGMGIATWEWEGMGFKNPFPLTSIFGYSPLTAPVSEVTLKRPANVDSQPDRNSPVVTKMSLTSDIASISSKEIEN